MTPNSGGGLGPQTFTVTYTDPAGATDIQVVYLQVGVSGGGSNSCFAVYIQGSNSLYLFNDMNTAILGPITPGSVSSVSNSQCTLSGNGGTVTASGIHLIVPFSFTFAPTYTGLKNILGYVQNYSGANSGFQMLGTWTPAAGGTITAVSVSPVNGSGLGPQTFSALYTDSAGGSDIQAAYIDFGQSIFATHSCIVVYVTANNTMYLVRRQQQRSGANHRRNRQHSVEQPMHSVGQRRAGITLGEQFDGSVQPDVYASICGSSRMSSAWHRVSAVRRAPGQTWGPGRRSG